MSNEQSNAENIQAIYEAFGKGDIPGILTRLADDVDWEAWPDNRAQAAGVAWLQNRKGHSGVIDFFQSIAGGLQVNAFEVRTILAGGDKVAAEVEVDFTVKATGKPLKDCELHLWTFNSAGKVTGLRHYVDTAKHIAAAGV